MSHFTTIQTQIRDIDALRDACVEMDLRLVPDTTCRGYAGVRRKADHVIQLKGKSGINLMFGLLAGAQSLDDGNYQDAARGANSAIDAGYNADHSSKSLDQLKQRYDQLATRRAEILKLLK
jgi:hypothetical protein